MIVQTYCNLFSSVLDIIFGQLAVECLVDDRVHSLRDAYHSGEDYAPRIGAVESAGGGDGDGAEQDGCREGYKSGVSAGDVLLERLHECGHNQCDEPGCEGGCGGNTHRFLLR